MTTKDDVGRTVQLICTNCSGLLITQEPAGAIEYINKEVNVKNLIRIIGSCIGPSNSL